MCLTVSHQLALLNLFIQFFFLCFCLSCWFFFSTHLQLFVIITISIPRQEYSLNILFHSVTCSNVNCPADGRRGSVKMLLLSLWIHSLTSAWQARRNDWQQRESVKTCLMSQNLEITFKIVEIIRISIWIPLFVPEKDTFLCHSTQRTVQFNSRQ